jgi:hypothetical protein
MMRFVGEHAILGSTTPPALLPADFFSQGSLLRNEAVFVGLNLVEQQSAGEETVEALLPRGLAFDPQASRPMHQHDTRSALVNVLAPMAPGSDKRLFDVLIAHAERSHALRELDLFVRADGKRTHSNTVMETSLWMQSRSMADAPTESPALPGTSRKAGGTQ